jgi:hypothetical protein
MPGSLSVATTAVSLANVVVVDSVVFGRYDNDSRAQHEETGGNRKV